MRGRALRRRPSGLALLAVRLLAAGGAVLAWAIAAPAWADVYGYLDTHGTAHFATEKLDERYQLFLRGDQPFDSAQLLAEGPAASAPKLADSLSRPPALKRYQPLVDAAAREFALEPALLNAVMAAESGFDPRAISGKGAIGLMQLLPTTAQRYGLKADGRQSIADKLADPQTNIRLGAHYLRDLLRRFPQQLDLVLASYNAGEGAVQKHGNQVPPYAETRHYVGLVTQFLQFYRGQGPSRTIRTTGTPTVALEGGSGTNAHSLESSDSGSSNDSSASDGAGGLSARRIHLTIPGRGGMPGAGPDHSR